MSDALMNLLSEIPSAATNNLLQSGGDSTMNMGFIIGIIVLLVFCCCISSSSSAMVWYFANQSS